MKTNEELYEMFERMNDKIDKIQNALDGNGAIGIIEQIRSNTARLNTLEQSFWKSYWFLIGAFTAINIGIGFAIKLL